MFSNSSCTSLKMLTNSSLIAWVQYLHVNFIRSSNYIQQRLKGPRELPAYPCCCPATYPRFYAAYTTMGCRSALKQHKSHPEAIFRLDHWHHDTSPLSSTIVPYTPLLMVLMPSPSILFYVKMYHS